MREWFVAGTGGGTLVFSAWGLGGIPAWSLHVLLAGGVLTLVSAMLPFPRHLRTPFSTLYFPLKSLKRLACWPSFYFSLAFLVYLFIGALNPGAEIVRDERGWWVEAVQASLASWLPSSVRSDYEPMNAWRVLTSFTAAFTLTWGLWAGITRRKPMLLTLWLFLLSGSAMGLVGILQHLTESKEVLWTFPSSNKHFWGSFFYRNQGAAYLNLILVLSGIMFFYHGFKCRLDAQSGGPHFLAFALLIVVVCSVTMSLSRGGILFGAVFVSIFLLLLLIFFLQSFVHHRSLWLTLLPLVLLIGTGFYSARFVKLDALEDRFSNFEVELEQATSSTRALLTKQTWKMAQDRLWLGWGAGSFRYIFPMYQREIVELTYVRKDRTRGWVGRMFFRYAHNDLVQFVAEFGVIGAVLLILLFLSLIGQSFYYCGEYCFIVITLTAGVLCAFGHAFFDFIFNSPAYWVAFLGMVAASVRLLCLEFKRAGA